MVCTGMVVNFTCTVEATNPAVDTFTWYENGSLISSKTDSGVWIKALDTGGEVTYRCQADNSVGTSNSDNITFIAGGEATGFFNFSEVRNIYYYFVTGNHSVT